jgi:hypothetical protein
MRVEAISPDGTIPPGYRLEMVPGIGKTVVPNAYRPLPDEYSAEHFLSRGQVVGLVLKVLAAVGLLAWRIVWHGGPTMMDQARIVLCILTVLGFVMIAYRAILFVKSAGHQPQRPSDEDLRKEPEGGWPWYTILVPMYLAEEPDRFRLVQKMVERLSLIDYPLERLRILAIVERHDVLGLRALRSVVLPAQFKVCVLPRRNAKGKPGAVVHALLAAGWHTGIGVIFDVEDGPEAVQCRVAAHQFAKEPPSVVCLQARLCFRGEATNWITRLFATEYAMWFYLVIAGLGNCPTPLGGTSNHYRMEAWLAIGILDPYNKVEDLAAATEIARRRWRIRMLDSFTFEDPNWLFWNWVYQRMRWIGGYILTWIIYMRHPVRFWRQMGTRNFLSWQLNIGFATFSVLVNPLLWALTAFYFTAKARGWSGITNGIESLYPLPVYYLGMASMLLGFTLMGYLHLAGAMERKLPKAIRAIPLLPAYWLMMWLASVMSVVELCIPALRLNWYHTKHHMLDEYVRVRVRVLRRLGARFGNRPEASQKEMEEFERDFLLEGSPADRVLVMTGVGAYMGNLATATTLEFPAIPYNP